MTTIPTTEDFFESQANQLFTLQKNAVYEIGNSSVKERRQKLKMLANAVQKYQKQIEKALEEDLQKHPTETGLMEIYPVLSEIRYAIKHLASWVNDKPVPTPLTLLGTRSFIRYESKGQVLILAPWNFPFYLTLSPLISAICGGNVAILKPSEFTPNTSSVIKELIGSVFEDKEVGVIEGDHRAAAYLTSLPFNHIFFTGAPTIGKKVMEAASKNLASVTLELGGKSPVVTDKTTDIKKIAKRLAWAKLLNSGQTCVAPDFLLVPASHEKQWIEAIQEAIKEQYGENPTGSKDFGQIINKKNKKRIKGYLEDAHHKGATIKTFGTDTENKLAPCLVSNATQQMQLMQEEIFGPVLPIIPYENDKELLDYLQGHPPLSLYISSQNRRFINKILNYTRAGATTINHFILHLSHHELPFGGLNFSGIGRSHGYMGFLEFVNQRPVMKQAWPISFAEILTAPYTPFKQKLINFIMRWF